MTTAAVTAREAGLLSCETCGLLSQPASAAEPGYCPRCGSELESRRHGSVERTWALVIAAAICYIPANMLPVLGTTTLGSTSTTPSWAAWCSCSRPGLGRWRWSC
jgi:paraquat-inducible protein A